MQVVTILVLVGLFYGQVFAAKVSKNCLWGRRDAATCCKQIPNGDSTHLANPQDCSSFYICRNNKPVLFPCQPGQSWSVPEQKCLAAANIDKCEQFLP